MSLVRQTSFKVRVTPDIVEGSGDRLDLVVGDRR